MLSLPAEIYTLILNELDVCDAVQLQRCCWDLYNNVEIASNAQERKWLTHLQNKTMMLDTYYEVLKNDNLKWFKAMGKHTDIEMLLESFYCCAEYDAICCAEYIYATAPCIPHTRLSTIWKAINRKYPTYRFCELFKERLGETKMQKLRALYQLNPEDAIREFGGVAVL